MLLELYLACRVNNSTITVPTHQKKAQLQLIPNTNTKSTRIIAKVAGKEGGPQVKERRRRFIPLNLS